MRLGSMVFKVLQGQGQVLTKPEALLCRIKVPRKGSFQLWVGSSDPCASLTLSLLPFTQPGDNR